MGLCEKNGHIGPNLFVDENDLDNLVVGDWKKPGDTRYPLNKLLIHLARKYPEDTFGVLVRGCDERGLKTLYIWNQLNPNNIIPVGIACPQELADACECSQPFPEDPHLFRLLLWMSLTLPHVLRTGWMSFQSALNVTAAGTSVPCVSARNAVLKLMN